MKEIRIIKDYYVWRNNGYIDNKWIVYCVKDSGEHTVKEIIIQTESEVKKIVNYLKDIYPKAKVRFLDKQKDKNNKLKQIN
jgi:hypothetical protein